MWMENHSDNALPVPGAMAASSFGRTFGGVHGHTAKADPARCRFSEVWDALSKTTYQSSAPRNFCLCSATRPGRHAFVETWQVMQNSSPPKRSVQSRPAPCSWSRRRDTCPIRIFDCSTSRACRVRRGPRQWPASGTCQLPEPSQAGTEGRGRSLSHSPVSSPADIQFPGEHQVLRMSTMTKAEPASRRTFCE